jgi:hypothetical protein
MKSQKMVTVTQNHLTSKLKSRLLLGNTDKRGLERTLLFFSYPILMSQARPLPHPEAGRMIEGERMIFTFSLCHELSVSESPATHICRSPVWSTSGEAMYLLCVSQEVLPESLPVPERLDSAPDLQHLTFFKK